MKRRYFRAPEGGRHYAYARLSDSEYGVIRQQARKAGLSVSDWVRRCINSVLLEEGDDVPLLEERRKSRREEADGLYE